LSSARWWLALENSDVGHEGPQLHQIFARIGRPLATVD